MSTANMYRLIVNVTIAGFIIDFIFCFGLNMNKQVVQKSSVILEMDDQTIFSCYSICWQVYKNCVAVGFLLTEINQNKELLKCYMIGERYEPLPDDFRHGEIELDVLVSFPCLSLTICTRKVSKLYLGMMNGMALIKFLFDKNSTCY